MEELCCCSVVKGGGVERVNFPFFAIVVELSGVGKEREQQRL